MTHDQGPLTELCSEAERSLPDTIQDDLIRQYHERVDYSASVDEEAEWHLWCEVQIKEANRLSNAYRRTGFHLRCFYCGCKTRNNRRRPNHRQAQDSRTRDHIFPYSLGGYSWVIACFSCNNDKADLSLNEFRAKRSVQEFWGEIVIRKAHGKRLSDEDFDGLVL